jgi:uncharacterized protein
MSKCTRPLDPEEEIMTFTVGRISRSMMVAGVAALLLSATKSVAMDPDIRRLQADAERGLVKQEIELGAAYFEGRGVSRDEKTAAYWYEKAANAGDPVAQNQIGYLYQVGIGVTRDPSRAVHWYQRAASGGYALAKVNLAVAYLFGTGVHKDTELALHLLEEAVGKGNGLAACYLGDIYEIGVGVPKDDATAMGWYETGVKLHDPRSQYRLGLMISLDPSRAGELSQAAKLLRASAAAGLVPAKHQLAFLLVQKPELAASADEAVNLLREAASVGFWKSSVLLGILAREGQMMPADASSAYYQFRVATLQGGDEASHLVANDLRVLTARLGASQTAQIDREADKWFQTHQLSLEFIFPDGETWKQYPAYALEKPAKDMHAGRLIASPSL